MNTWCNGCKTACCVSGFGSSPFSEPRSGTSLFFVRIQTWNRMKRYSKSNKKNVDKKALKEDENHCCVDLVGRVDIISLVRDRPYIWPGYPAGLSKASSWYVCKQTFKSLPDLQLNLISGHQKGGSGPDFYIPGFSNLIRSIDNIAGSISASLAMKTDPSQ